MKKGLRNTVMSVAALLALVSCGAPKVTEEVAKQRAQEITAKREADDFELPTKITITATSKGDATLKMGDLNQSETLNEKVKMVLDLENHYYYLGIDSAEDGIENQWCYVEGTTAYLVIEDETGEDPIGKVYQEAPVENPDDFATAFESVINEVYTLVLNSEYLDIENLDQTLLNALGVTGELDSKISYTSSAEGNLGINAKAEIDGTMEGMTTSANIKVEVSFDNYLLMGTSITMKVNASDPASGLSMSITQKDSVNFDYGTASINKPNLAEFTKVE